jgi:hypothetical protein
MNDYKKSLKVLELARAKLSVAFCQEQYALNSKGEGVSWASDDAVSFCASGAIKVAAYNIGDLLFNRRVTDLILSVNNIPDFILVQFNDRSTKEEVLAAFDKAIAYLKEKIRADV